MKSKISKENKIGLQKMLVGHYIENIPEKCTKKIIYLLQGDGLWEIRKNKLGIFRTQLLSESIPGLKTTMEKEPMWELNVPLIPINFWEKTVSFFKEVQKVHNAEAYLQFFYDVKKEEYILHCPQQEVTKASVKYKTDPEFEKDKYIFVLEIHSHGTMNAFFSGTDDADEKSDRFYGVIGKINNTYPEFKFRLVLGGRHIETDLYDLFEQKDEELYPKEWINKITKEKNKFKKFVGKNFFVDDDDISFYKKQREGQLTLDYLNQDFYDECEEDDECEKYDYSISKFIEKYGK